MIAITPMFEVKIPFNDQLAVLIKNPSVHEFIHLSKQLLQNGEDSFTEPEQQKYRGMFEDEAVKDYIRAAAKTGERDGWIRGGLIGGLIGSTAAISGFIDIVGGTPLAALALLGAIAGGLVIGYPVSKLLYIWRKWKAEDNVVKLAKVGGKIGGTTPFITANSNIRTF